MIRSATKRVIRPNADIDPARDEMLHSLFDGRAKYKADQSSAEYQRDISRHQHSTNTSKPKVTLANTYFPTYLA